MPYPKHDDAAMRLKKIEGQVRGLQQMVAERRYCIEIIQQVTAVRKALDQVALQVLRKHVQGCVAEAVRSKHNGHEKVDELIRTIDRFVK
ncbi:MAG: metal-sensitive transcriptional regulator [Candidatus Omnitrophica bacterium]|nr:metal-sensitive transcriptional regulator [Candidatus Omnitrophota bacterium]